ncbi:hypothetical protein C8F04DRAFT_1202752 [Mycena alexandri]|uniref:Uncharacterized protein n=1 Tax=Mycena alexandri TaxID=1745969 RepID=A0AAD6WL48_9AGAR|nr:hypothetical protein C8F04DRAFT_1202752 [Mycena alexandri]
MCGLGLARKPGLGLGLTGLGLVDIEARAKAISPAKPSQGFWPEPWLRQITFPRFKNGETKYKFPGFMAWLGLENLKPEAQAHPSQQFGLAWLVKPWLGTTGFWLEAQACTSLLDQSIALIGHAEIVAFAQLLAQIKEDALPLYKWQPRRSGGNHRCRTRKPQAKWRDTELHRSMQMAAPYLSSDVERKELEMDLQLNRLRRNKYREIFGQERAILRASCEMFPDPRALGNWTSALVVARFRFNQPPNRTPRSGSAFTPQAAPSNLNRTPNRKFFIPEKAEFCSGSGFGHWLNRTRRSSSAFAEMCPELEPNRTLPALVGINTYYATKMMSEPMYSFLHLVDLTVRGGFLLRSTTVSVLKPSYALRRLHIVGLEWSMRRWLRKNGISYFAAILTHLRLSDLEDEIISEVETALELSGEVPPLPSTLEMVLVKPVFTPLPNEGCECCDPYRSMINSARWLRDKDPESCYSRPMLIPRQKIHISTNG